MLSSSGAQRTRQGRGCALDRGHGISCGCRPSAVEKFRTTVADRGPALAGRWGRRVRAVRQLHDLRAVVLGALLTVGYLRREQIDGPEVYVLMLCRRGLMMASANDLIVIFLASRSCRSPSTCSPPCTCAFQIPGERPQVLHPWCLLVRVLPVRHRPGLRRNWLDQLATSGVLRRRAARQRLAAGRDRPAARGPRLQGGRGAVPHVGARRVPRRADPGHAFMASAAKAAAFAGDARVLGALRLSGSTGNHPVALAVASLLVGASPSCRPT